MAGADKERETAYKGFYVFQDQYEKLLELSTQNKIKGGGPNSVSGIVRVALDEYFKA
jgi:hypothetical protein